MLTVRGQSCTSSQIHSITARTVPPGVQGEPPQGKAGAGRLNTQAPGQPGTLRLSSMEFCSIIVTSNFIRNKKYLLNVSLIKIFFCSKYQVWRKCWFSSGQCGRGCPLRDTQLLVEKAEGHFQDIFQRSFRNCPLCLFYLSFYFSVYLSASLRRFPC